MSFFIHIDTLTPTENSLAAHDFGQYDHTKSKRQPVEIGSVKYTCCMDAVRKLHPDITDKKEMKRIEDRYRKRAKFI